MTVLCAFLCPFFKCNEFGQKVYSHIKSYLLKLNFGIQDFINQKLKERAGEQLAISASLMNILKDGILSTEIHNYKNILSILMKDKNKASKPNYILFPITIHDLSM